MMASSNMSCWICFIWVWLKNKDFIFWWMFCHPRSWSLQTCVEYNWEDDAQFLSSRCMHGNFGVNLSFIENKTIESRLVSMKRFPSSYMQNKSLQWSHASCRNSHKQWYQPSESLSEACLCDRCRQTWRKWNMKRSGARSDWLVTTWRRGWTPSTLRYSCTEQTLHLVVVHSGQAEA